VGGSRPGVGCWRLEVDRRADGGTIFVSTEPEQDVTQPPLDRASSLDPRHSRLQPPPSGLGSSATGLDPRTAAALAYLAGPFSGALVLWVETGNRDVRFHAWQSILALGGLMLLVLVSSALTGVALFFSATAMLVMLNIATALAGVLAIVWAVCLWKAFAGGRWKLPLAGDYAERRA
jgi:uncharacterized membrane protein